MVVLMKYNSAENKYCMQEYINFILPYLQL